MSKSTLPVQFEAWAVISNDGERVFAVGTTKTSVQDYYCKKFGDRIVKVKCTGKVNT